MRRRPIARAAVGTAVVAGTATAVSGRVARRQERRSTEAPEPTPPPASAASSDPLDQLERLGDLKARGVLSEAEFEAQKQRLLQQMGQ